MVGDAEILYRCVPNSEEYFTNIDGKCVFNSTAFNDRTSKPSVDRADLCERKPATAKKNPSDGVVSLQTVRVRAIASVTHKADENTTTAHKIDVVADPIKDDPVIPDNPAHALIVAAPEFASKSIFRKLRAALSILATEAGWTIKPG